MLVIIVSALLAVFLGFIGYIAYCDIKANSVDKNTKSKK